MEKRNRRIFAGFYRRYDSKFVYVAAVVPDADSVHFRTAACADQFIGNRDRQKEEAGILLARGVVL